eukprot:1723696-Alexandrium_andersonii.AAC.1
MTATGTRDWVTGATTRVAIVAHAHTHRRSTWVGDYSGGNIGPLGPRANSERRLGNENPPQAISRAPSARIPR